MNFYSQNKYMLALGMGHKVHRLFPNKSEMRD